MAPNVTRYSYAALGRQLVLSVDDDGFVYKSKRRVNWNELAGYRASPAIFPDRVLEAMHSLKPRLVLYLKSGDLIKVRGDILVRNDETSSAEREAPAAFQELIETIASRGIPKWGGPTEEATLYGTAGVLMVVGFIAGVAAAATLGKLPAALPFGVTAAALLAQLTFIISPFIAKRLRTTYLREAR